MRRSKSSERKYDNSFGWRNAAHVSASDSYSDLTAQASYQNSKGEKFSSRQADILMHVVMHGAYHRGQIAAAIRAAGSEPAYTDFIHCIRQGFLA